MGKESQEYPKGHFIGLWTGLGIAIFSGLGVPLSIATDNFAFIGVGPAIGVAVGAGIGQSIETKYEQEGRIRPLTEVEKRKRKKILWSSIVIFTTGIAVLLMIVFKVL